MFGKVTVYSEGNFTLSALERAGVVFARGPECLIGFHLEFCKDRGITVTFYLSKNGNDPNRNDK